MADKTKIEWTDATWNPITGCSVVSPGCTNCYAMKLAGTRLKHHPSRAGLTNPSKAGPVWNGKVTFNEQWLDQPLRWKKPRMIFVCAHGDLFAENVPDEWIDKVFAVMALCPQHTFQVLTKRADRMREYLSDLPVKQSDIYSQLLTIALPRNLGRPVANWFPLTNVWLGVSVEDQTRADERIPALLDTPAVVRFISAEPLLGPVELDEHLNTECWGDCAHCDKGHRPLHNCHQGRQSNEDFLKGRSGLDWVIVGGESGRDARPMHPDWALSLLEQCQTSSVPFFFKQWGEFSGGGRMPKGWYSSQNQPLKLGYHDWSDGVRSFRVGKTVAGRLLNGCEWSEMPEVSNG